MRVACVLCAVAAVLLALIGWNDLYFTGFPDSHLTDYDKAAELPKRVLMRTDWGFALLFLFLAVWPLKLRTRGIGLAVATIALVIVTIVQWVGIPWYFITHLGLDNGIGG